MWTRELQEVIVEEKCHIYKEESTHMTFISRVTPRPLPSKRGALDPELVRSNTGWPQSRHRRLHSSAWKIRIIIGRGSYSSGNFPGNEKAADEYVPKIHLDGARIFNASLASGVPVKEYARYYDSVMFCLSKGLPLRLPYAGV